MEEIEKVMIQNIRDIEQRDERQIMAELAGETVAEYIYETSIMVKGVKTRKVRLAWVGVREVARSRGNLILDNEPIIEETDDHWRIVVRVTDLTRNFSVFGGCHQPKMMKVNDTSEGGQVIGHHFENDEFSFQKCLSKAQRNAFDKCIPAEFAAKAIDRFLRSLGKPPIPKHGTQRPRPTSGTGYTAKAAPKKSDIRPREEWNLVTQKDVPDFPRLEPIIWSLCKLQPKEMYAELGVSSREDMTIPAWEAFLTLKERFVPVEGPPTEEQSEEAVEVTE